VLIAFLDKISLETAEEIKNITSGIFMIRSLGISNKKLGHHTHG